MLLSPDGGRARAVLAVQQGRMPGMCAGHGWSAAVYVVSHLAPAAVRDRAGGGGRGRAYRREHPAPPLPSIPDAHPPPRPRRSRLGRRGGGGTLLTTPPRPPSPPGPLAGPV